MKLPEIDFNAPVPDTSRAPLIVDESRRRALQTVQKGLEAFGQELVKSQMSKAGADFSQSLNDIEAELDENPTVSTEWIRKKLGSLDALPPELRAQVTEQGLDLNTGEIVETDKEGIPSWIVASHVFDARAKQALGAASQNVTVGGWAADFQEKAQGEVIARKAKINERAMKAGLEYMVQAQTESAVTLANAGRFDGEGGARDVVAKSRAMDPTYKEKILSHIDKIEQVRPVYEALQRDDFGAMAEFVGKLNDPKEFTTLNPSERMAFSERLKSEIKQFQAGMKKSEDDALKRNSEAGWNGIFAKVRAGAPISYKDIPPPGTVPADEQKQMIDYIDNHRKGVAPKTDLALYAELSDEARNNPEKFAARSLTSLINWLSPADFKHFANLQAKPPAGNTYADDVINTTEAIDARMPKGYDSRSVKGDAKKEAILGRVQSLVQYELSGLGTKPTPAQRDEAIERVIKENVKVEPGWFSDSVKTAASTVPPRYVVALRRISSDLGFGLSEEGLVKTYEDFAFYESGITQAWGPQAGPRKKLTPELALGAYGYLKSNWGAIDAELRRVSKPTDNPNRTALAVQGFLATQR